MKYIFFLSGDYVELGREEIASLFDLDKCKIAGRVVIAGLNNDEKSINKIFKRLSLTKNIYRYLFECKIDDLTEAMKSYDWKSVYDGSFCLRIEKLNENVKETAVTDGYNSGKHIKEKSNEKINKNTHSRNRLSEKNLSGYIWRKLNNPKVDLKNPKTLIQIFVSKNKVYCGLLIYSNKEDFDKRKSHNRPFPHPSSLHPKVARALINLTGIKEDEVLFDPFCGTGGFLIESGLMGIRSIGYDINKTMIKGCIDNLKYFKISSSKVKRQNALKITDKFDCAVTDLPYGLNSNVISELHSGSWKKGRINKKIQKDDFTRDLEEFYLQFLKNLRKKLGKKAVIVFPDYANYRKLLKQSKFRIEFEFSNYVHGSLTRKMVKIR